jgi:hypothetical protein
MLSKIVTGIGRFGCTAILSQLLQAGCYSVGLGQKVPYCPSLDGKELQFSPLDQLTFLFPAHSSPTDDTTFVSANPGFL